MKIKDILAYLEKEKIQFEVYHLNDDNKNIEYVPASLKRIITNGIYFMVDSNVLQKYPLKESIIISNEKLDTKNINIIVNNSQLAHYKVSSLLKPKENRSIHPTAIISPQARIAHNVSIGPYCVVGNCILEENVTLKNHVVIEDNVEIQRGSFIDSNSVIGAAGLAWIWDENGERIMQPQLGGVIIEKNCILATDVTVVRGSLSEHTLIKEYTVIAHGTKIGHGAQIHKQVHMANNVSIAGNAVIGDRSFLGSACIISSNISIPNDCIVGAGAMVNKNFEESFITLAGVPAKIIQKENYKEKPNGAPIPYIKK